jgi:hypothetical protein
LYSVVVVLQLTRDLKNVIGLQFTDHLSLSDRATMAPKTTLNPSFAEDVSCFHVRCFCGPTRRPECLVVHGGKGLRRMRLERAALFMASISFSLPPLSLLFQGQTAVSQPAIGWPA